jgi:mRNA-degrading endonuclease RelE of RelBE toxin-antitoxin system
MDKGIDRLVRKKKFTSLPTQIRELTEKCRRGEFEGDHITHMDAPVVYDVYKLRLPNPDTNVGKSNGYRVVYMVVTEHRIVIFLAIYYKKEDADLPDKYIRTLIDGCMLEFLPEEE